MVTRFNFRKVARKFLETAQVFFPLSLFLPACTLDIHPASSSSKTKIAASAYEDTVWPPRKREAALPALQITVLWREGPSLPGCHRETLSFGR